MSERQEIVLDGFEGQRVAVLGDAMLDGYLEGSAERVCREGPVPVVRLDAEHDSPGGAANMAANLAEMGAQVAFFSAVGEDGDGALLVRLLTERGVDCRGVLPVPGRTTIAKRRLLADGQLIARFDAGTTRPIAADTAAELTRQLEESLDGGAALVVSDYRCGVVSEPVVQALVRLRERVGGPLVIDSTHLGAYRALRPDVVKPSLAEALSQLAIAPAPPSSRPDLAEALGDALLDLSGASVVALTLDEDGAVVFAPGGTPIRSASRFSGDAHPAGAGDTYLAAFTLALGARATVPEAAEIASAAAGVVVAHAGTSLCSLPELRRALASTPAEKIVGLDGLAVLGERSRAAGAAVVFTNGCFDILHPGHIALLEQARRFGQVLVVGVNSDESVRALKGEGRPVNELADRLRVLSALSFVDRVAVFDDPTATRLIESLKPDVYVKGGDYHLSGIPEAEAVARLGGRVEILPYFGSASTTRIIDRIRRASVDQVS